MHQIDRIAACVPTKWRVGDRTIIVEGDRSYPNLYFTATEDNNNCDDHRCGHGRTPDEAIEDLLAQLED